MTVRSDRLFGPVGLPAGSWVSLCTVPASQVWLLKSLRVVSIAEASCYFDLTLLEGDPAGALFWETVLTGRGIVIDSTWQVLDEGDELYGRASIADSAVIWASGAKLQL